MLKSKPTFTTLLLVLLILRSAAQQGSEILIKANKASLERDYSKAYNLYTKYIQLNSTDFRGYFNRGTSAYNARRYTSAIQDFTRALQLNPIFLEAYYFRGQSYYHSKKYNEAIADYTSGLLKKPNNSSFLKLRAEAYTASGKKDKALVDLNKAINADKISGDLYKRRAELKIQLNDIKGSIRDYNAVEKLIPTYKMVHYLKGKLYLQIKEIEFACEEFEKALEHKIVVADQLNKKYCTSM